MFGNRRKVSGRETKRTPRASGSSPVFSYYNNRPTSTDSTKQRRRSGNLLSDRVRRAQLRYHLDRIPTYVAAALVIGSLLYATTLDSKPKVLIGKAPASNTLVRTTASYQQGITDIFDNSLLSQNKLTVNTESIARQIENKYPEIQQATISIPLIGRHPVVGLDPAEPALLYKTQGRTYIMSKDGRVLVAIDELKTSSQSPTLPILIDETNANVEQGKQSIPKEDVTFITTIIFQLQSKGIVIESLKLPAQAYQLHVKPKEVPYLVKFQLNGNARVQAGAFLAVRARLTQQSITPAEYIDARVEDRVYYK